MTSLLFSEPTHLPPPDPDPDFPPPGPGPDEPEPNEDIPNIGEPAWQM